MTVPMARRSLGGFEQWAFAIAHRPPITMAEWIRRTFDRVDPP
jgi:hypothetical protein